MPGSHKRSENDGRSNAGSLGRAAPSSVFWSRAGLVLIAASFLLWGLLPIVPFLPLATETKVALGGTIFVVMEVSWWGGLAITGPAAARRFSKWWKGRPSAASVSTQERGSDG